MKRALSLLLAVFMLMSTLPSSGEARGTEPEMACVSKCCLSKNSKGKTPCDQKKGKGCCSNGICNPFTMCKICFGYEAGNSDLSFSSNGEKKQYSFPESVLITDGYFSNCWQPPEMI
jgi:hypothetical protein